MANVCCVFVKLCVLFSILSKFCNSNEIQNIELQNTHYVVLPKLNGINSFTILRDKRDVAPPASVVTANSSADTTTIKPIENDNGNNTKTINLENSPHLLGVNGTGQRKDVNTIAVNSTAKPTIVSEPLNSDGGKLNKGLTSSKTLNSSAPTAGSTAQTVVDSEYEKIFDTVDTPDDSINETLREHFENTTLKKDYYQFYNSTIVVDKEKAKEHWSDSKNFTVSSILSKSHRRAITVQLSFDFPFYGHLVRNVTVATGGFLYTGEYVHSWLAATQYIAPLMANFDTSISNTSSVKYFDNGTAFTVIWEQVPLQDHMNESFTFSVTLFNTGDITFAYKSVPIAVEKIGDEKHPVKIGLSDAYIIDKTIYFARRKTIYEYHRVNIDHEDIQNNTFIYLKALPTCLDHTDCVSCIDKPVESFKCAWCPALNRCSTGTDRKRQEWVHNGCERTQLIDSKTCPALGTKGNNYSSQQQVVVPAVDKDRWTHSGTESTNVNNKPSLEVKKAALAHVDDGGAKHGGASYAVGLLLPIFVILSLVVWVFYAYRNPHTKSGQLLIQLKRIKYRPSQWSWRRGEARYTAATIHM